MCHYLMHLLGDVVFYFLLRVTMQDTIRTTSKIKKLLLKAMCYQVGCESQQLYSCQLKCKISYQYCEQKDKLLGSTIFLKIILNCFCQLQTTESEFLLHHAFFFDRIWNFQSSIQIFQSQVLVSRCNQQREAEL